MISFIINIIESLSKTLLKAFSRFALRNLGSNDVWSILILVTLLSAVISFSMKQKTLLLILGNIGVILVCSMCQKIDTTRKFQIIFVIIGNQHFPVKITGKSRISNEQDRK